MSRAGLLLATILVLTTSVYAGPGVSGRVEERAGKNYVILANKFMELTFEPGRGGRCVRFRFLDNDEEIIGDRPFSGMFIDHWAKYTWPSGLMWLPYEYKIVGDGKQKAGVQLWVTVPEMGGGRGAKSPESSVKMPTTPDLIGLIVQKTIWLNAENNVIVVEQEIKNPTKESRAVAPYIQHCLSMGGSRYHDTWYLPSINGIEVNIQPDEKGGKTIGPNYINNPAAGWIGVIDRKTKRGMLFAFDYDYTYKIYTCGSTAEWFMDSTPVGPGKSFKFHHVIKPIRGFEDIVHGSENIVVDIRPDEKDGQVAVTLDMAAVKNEFHNLKAHISVIGWKSKEEIAQHSKTIERLGFTKMRSVFSFTPKKLSDGVVIKVVVQGTDFKDHCEYYYAGDKEEHDRRYSPWATKGQALAGSRGDAYFRKQPRKHKIFDKPDFSKLAGPAAGKFKVLVLFGLFTHILNIDDALEGWSHNGNQPEFAWANCPPNAIETFPGTYKELFSFNTIVLSDVNYKAIGDIGFEMICDYVEQGGGLLVTGGPYAFGNGEYEGTRLLEVLPVTLSGAFDLKWAGKGKSWPLTPADTNHPVLKGVSFAGNPRVFQHHFVTPKQGAQVVLESAGKPALILGRYGKGKVAVLTLSPTGMGKENETQWWDWDGWFKLVKNLLRWLDS